MDFPKIWCFFFVIQIQCIFAKWETALFEADYYHSSSLSHFDDKYSCYYVCKDEKICKALPAGCKFIEKAENLVEISPLHKDQVKVWSREPIEKVPHFLILDGKSIYDYSLDPISSPRLKFEAKIPESQHCALFDGSKQEVFIATCQTENFYQWNFDHKNAFELSIKDQVEKRSPCDNSCATSQDGKVMVKFGSTQTVFVYNNREIKYLPVNGGRKESCSAFHPTKNNLVYLFGGPQISGAWTVDEAFYLDLTTGLYTALAPMPQKRKLMSCIGIVSNNEPGILLVGGRNAIATEQGSEWVNFQTVWKYLINFNNYEILPELKAPLYSPAITVRDGSVFLFGGFNDGVQKSVYRLNYSKDTNDLEWETLHPMEKGSGFISVIPFN